MKLRWIHESLMSAKTHEALATEPLAPQLDQPPADNISSTDSAVTQATGVPTKPRHRQFFGMPTTPEQL